MDTEQRRRPEGSRPRTDSQKRPASSENRRTAAQRPNSNTARTGSRTRAPEPSRNRQETRQRQNSRRETQQRQPSGRRRTSTAAPRQKIKHPEIIYTPPKPFSRNRFLLRLATVVAVVLAVTFGMSIFFKVKTVTVSGANLSSPWTVREASGIEEGEGLLTLNQPRASGRITAALPYVKSARIGIKLPDTVNIEIVETEVVYSIQAQDNTWWLISSQGKVIEKTDAVKAGDYTKVLGVKLAAPLADQPAEAVEENATAGTEDPTQTAAPVTVTGARRLETALELLQCLEANGFIGDTASVDVSNLQSLVVWYGTRYEVQLGDGTNLDYKIRCMKEAIEQMSQYQSGALDISFTIWEDKVVYTPFE